jgi:Asp-tRNA(Asn)/Glu-tRNA(Gln) amidotransferase C subunit
VSQPGAEAETIHALARAAGIEIPAEDVTMLSGAFANQLQAIAALEDVDVDGVEPMLPFDPRWT